MRQRAIVFVCLLAVWLVLIPRAASAQEGILTGMQAGVDSVFSSVLTTVTFASGAVTRTESQNINPTFRLNISTLLFPGLRLSAGNVFEVNSVSSTSSGIRTDSTFRANRPFFLLRSTNPVFSPGVGYYRRSARDKTQGVAGVGLFNDEYSAFLGWKPAGGPRSNFQFLRTNTYDDGHAFQNVTKDFGSLISNYRYRNLDLYYRGLYLNTNDRITGLETRQVTNAIRANYFQSFIQKRLVWNTSANAQRQNLRVTVHGTGGEVAVPVTPFAGLASITDTPQTDTLLSNGALIDGSLTTSAGVDLGLPQTPADAQLRSVGLDLLTPMEVSRLLLWVDRDLPVEVANTFTWDVYSSTDNVMWRRETTVSLAPFGTFENRFEIDFPSVTARYVKVVTRPLSAVVPDSSSFQDIFVTELQAFARLSATQVKDRRTRDTYLLNTDVKLRLLDAPALYYEGYYLANGTDGLTPTRDTLSNGFSMNHTFGRMFSAYGRVAREQGRQVQGDRVATVANGTLTFEPIPAFRSSLLYSRLDERVGGVPTTRQVLWVQNMARPYRGINVLVGLGWSSMELETGEINRDRLANLTATVTPRQNVTVTVNYTSRITARTGMFVGPSRSVYHRAYAAIVVDPLPSLHLRLGQEVIVATGQKTRPTFDIGASWSPFPDGTLQFLFAYDENARPAEFGSDRNTVAAVRWNVSRKSYFDVSYQKSRSATALLTSESRVFSVRVRLFL